MILVAATRPLTLISTAVPPGQIALGSMIGADLLLVSCAILILLSLVFFGAMLMARRELSSTAGLARKRGLRMNELMRTVLMAENIAGLGIWQYDPNTGTQTWSNGMRRLFGVNHAEPFLPGDAETLLYANDIDLIGAVKSHSEETGIFEVQFEVFGFDGVGRSISMQACNLRNRDCSVDHVIAVLQDKTDQIAKVRELEYSRAVAVREADQARELAETDPLTGLSNRRRVMDQLDRLIVEARSVGRPLMLVIFDIDRFKAVNDTYGHAEGDKVLKNVARIASEQSREGDVVARVGGEEFVWVVPGASEQVARMMTERLRQSVAQCSATDCVPAVTISAGFAALCPGDTSLSLFARADSALYEAKNAGRNQVRMAA